MNVSLEFVTLSHTALIYLETIHVVLAHQAIVALDILIAQV